MDYNLPTALVASGRGIRFPQGIYDSANSILVTDMRVVTGTSDIEDSGQFPVGDCCVYTAAGILLQSMEIQRVSGFATQDIMAHVGTGTRLQAGAWYANQGKNRLEQLAIKYEEFYQPVKTRRL